MLAHAGKGDKKGAAYHVLKLAALSNRRRWWMGEKEKGREQRAAALPVPDLAGPVGEEEVGGDPWLAASFPGSAMACGGDLVWRWPAESRRGWPAGLTCRI